MTDIHGSHPKNFMTDFTQLPQQNNVKQNVAHDQLVDQSLMVSV